MRTLWPLLAVTLLTGTLAVVGALAAPALAHSVLVSSDPQDGATLSAPPARLELVFDSDIVTIGTEVALTGPQGRVSTAEPVLDGPRVSVGLPTDVPAGDYEVAWRVTSTDGHPISDTLDYTVEAAPTRSATSTPTVAPPPSATTRPSDPAPPPSVSPPPVTPAGDQPSDAVASPSTQTAVASTDGGTVWPWAAAGVALAAAAAAAGLVGLRRRRRGERSGP